MDFVCRIQRVVGQEIQTVRKPLLELHVQRVVAGIPPHRIDGDDIGELRKSPAYLRISRRDQLDGNLVDARVLGGNPVPCISEIAQFKDSFPALSVLYAKFPLL